jgi:hypothetical protein
LFPDPLRRAIKAYSGRTCRGPGGFQNHRGINTICRDSRTESRMNINRNVLYMIIGVLAIAVGVLSYQLY